MNKEWIASLNALVETSITKMAALQWVLSKKHLFEGFCAKSPEASGPFCQFVVPGLPFGVSQSRQHPGRRFPGDFTLGVEVPHGLSRLLETTKNLRQKRGAGAFRGAIFALLVFDIHPEPKILGYPEFHSTTDLNSHGFSAVKLAP